MVCCRQCLCSLARWLVVLLFLGAGAALGQTASDPAVGGERGLIGVDDYRLAPGDQFSILVFGEPELTRQEVTLNATGDFSYPFLGTIVAVGLTPLELERLLIERLSGDYLVNPQITVSMLTFRRYFIHGEVRNAGGYAWQPDLTVRRAVAIAGGFTERASRRRVDVVREDNADGEAQRVDLDSVIRPGDIVTVGQSWF
jgi:polysaccharide biosynthesis/export protein VpsN